MKRIAVIGSSGQLGSALMDAMAGETLFPFSHEDMEIVDFAPTRAALEDVRPEVIINTAAFHNVTACEADPARAFLVNATAVKHLAETARILDAVFVHIGTDYVYGLDTGRDVPYEEMDLPGPVNLYGASKLAGEYAALAGHAQTFIFRTSGLYGLQGAASKGGNFVDKRLRDAASCSEIAMSSEQRLTPTFTQPLARNIAAVLSTAKARPGIYHATCDGECSWAEFTTAIYEISGRDVKVIPTDRGGMQDGVRKPLYSVLANRRLQRMGLDNMPHWRDALGDYLKQKSEELR